MRLRRACTTLTILLCLIPVAASAAATPCEPLLTGRADLTDAFNQEIKIALVDHPAMRRLYIRMQKRALRSETLAKCAERGGCTPEDIAKIVREAIAALPDRTQRLGYGFLIGGMIANAALSAGITTWANPLATFKASFVAFFLGQASFIGLNLLAPFLEPVSNRIRRAVFALNRPMNPTSGFEAQANATNSTFTLREQHAVDRIMQFRNAVKTNFNEAASAVDRGDHVTVTGELADALLAGYRYFRDIDPTEPAITSAIRASFLRKVTDPAALHQPIIDSLRRIDPMLYDAPATRAGEPSPREYFEKALRAWLATS
jgi:hypothetical protein